MTKKKSEDEIDLKDALIQNDEAQKGPKKKGGKPGIPDFYQEADDKSMCVGFSENYIRKHRITTLAQAIKVSGVNLDEWEVDRWLWNKWEVGAKDASGQKT